MHMFHEGIASRGSQDIGSCLLKHRREMDTSAKHLIMYSHSCGGQNRNINIACLLMHIVSNTDFSFTEIDHKFMVSGHSYLPNDRDFGSIETAKRPTQHIYTPEHWYDLVKKSRRVNPFHVTEMSKDDFLSFKDLTAAIVNRKKDIHVQSVEWLKMRWISVSKDKPLRFSVRYNHNTLEALKTVDLKRKSKGRPIDLGRINLKPLYDGPRAINPNKLNDLKSLLQFVPPVHHPFYMGLVQDHCTESGNEASGDESS